MEHTTKSIFLTEWWDAIRARCCFIDTCGYFLGVVWTSCQDSVTGAVSGSNVVVVDVRNVYDYNAYDIIVK